jgi:hypothetical protein
VDHHDQVVSHSLADASGWDWHENRNFKTHASGFDFFGLSLSIQGDGETSKCECGASAADLDPSFPFLLNPAVAAGCQSFASNDGDGSLDMVLNALRP